MRADQKDEQTTDAGLKDGPRLEWWSWIAGAAAVFTLLGVLCALAGYGVAMSVQDVFGIPFESLATTHFDHIQLSYIAVLHILQGITSSMDEFADFLQILMVFAIVYLGAVILNAIILGFFLLSERYPAAEIAFNKITRSVKASVRHDAYWVSVAKFLLYGGIATIVTTVGVWALTMLTLTVLFLLIGAPWLGLNAGKKHLETYVVEPKRCRPLADRSARLKMDKGGATEAFATCLRYESKEQAAKEGRVAFMTATSLVLFDPSSGEVVRLPMQDASITVIGHLKCCDAPNRQQ